MDLAFVGDIFVKLMSALPVTLEVWSLSVALGALIGAGVTWMRRSGSPPLAIFARVYVFVFRSTPLLIQLFIVYYGLSSFPAVRHSVCLAVPAQCVRLRRSLAGAYAPPPTRARSFAARSPPFRMARSRRRGPAACRAFGCFAA